jgi:hypothetical protein
MLSSESVVGAQFGIIHWQETQDFSLKKTSTLRTRPLKHGPHSLIYVRSGDDVGTYQPVPDVIDALVPGPSCPVCPPG